MKWRKRKKQEKKASAAQPHAASKDATSDIRSALSSTGAKSAPMPEVLITRTLLDRTAELLASFAEQRQAEGVVYWFGIEFGASAVVTTLVVPNADTRWGCVRTSPEANAEALSAIVGTPLVLIGQAHSHPANGVRHSRVDDQETFARFDGAVSVVVPYFGRRGLNLRRCGVHRHGGGEFSVVPPSQVEQHIRVLPGEEDFRQPTLEQECGQQAASTDGEMSGLSHEAVYGS